MGSEQQPPLGHRSRDARRVHPHLHTWELEHDELDPAGRVVQLSSFQRLLELI